MLTLTQVWGALLILVVCPGLGAVPLTPWLMQRWPVGDRPAPPVKTVGVATAFAQGGAIAGSLALALEAAKGIGAVLLARHYFPADPEWEVIALMALVMGRYWGAQAVGTTSVLWGALVHSPIAAGLTLLISLLGFTIFRERQQGRLLVLVLFPVLTALQAPDGVRVLLTACLCALIGWIYQKMPADVDLPAPASRLESQRLWGFFRSDRALLALGQSLQPGTVGGKAMRLSQLLAAGYPVPPGYVLPAGDDPALLIEITQPAPTTPVIVRASAIDDQPALATSAGQYAAVADITSQEALFAAMSQVFRSYDRASAGQYRRDRGLPEASLAVMVQQQVAGLCSGVAFSRDPFTCQGAAVVIEANWGAASRVTAGQEPPERYQVTVPDDLDEPLARRGPDGWRIPPALTLPVEGTGDIPSRLLQEVAFLARHLEQRDRGIPQNIEWSFDGDRLWLLQSRPIIPPAVRPAIPSGLLAGTAAHPPTPPVVLSGLPVCPGTAIGKIVVLKALTAPRPITATDIVVVPYLKAGEIPALAQAGGLIAETGGQLSNGAIAAREYGLPTIVLPHRGGRDRLTPAQTVRLQGTTGLVELW